MNGACVACTSWAGPHALGSTNWRNPCAWQAFNNEPCVECGIETPIADGPTRTWAAGGAHFWVLLPTRDGALKRRVALPPVLATPPCDLRDALRAAMRLLPGVPTTHAVEEIVVLFREAVLAYVRRVRARLILIRRARLRCK